MNARNAPRQRAIARELAGRCWSLAVLDDEHPHNCPDDINSTVAASLWEVVVKIGIDIDGVTADFVTTFLPVLSELVGREVRYEEMTKYMFQDVLGYDDSMEQRVREEIDRRDVLRHLPQMPYSRETINRLGKHHEVHFVTARPEWKWGDVTRDWLSANGFCYDTVLFREGRKAEAAEGYDLFVEDSLGNALELTDQGIYVCLYDQPWNQADELPEGCTRVKSWEGIEEMVREMERR